jgi:hypothetical protein
MIVYIWVAQIEVVADVLSMRVHDVALVLEACLMVVAVHFFI